MRLEYDPFVELWIATQGETTTFAPSRKEAREQLMDLLRIRYGAEYERLVRANR